MPNPQCPVGEKNTKYSVKHAILISKLCEGSKIQRYFIALCFSSLILFSMHVSQDVAKITLSAARIDKQVAMLISTSMAFRENQQSINKHYDIAIKELQHDVAGLQLSCQEVHIRLAKEVKYDR